MHISSRLLFKTAIVTLGLMLIAGLVVVSSSTKQASALSASDWTVVKTAVNAFLTGSQSATGDDGEAGYVMTQAGLKSRIDSNGDMSPTGTIGPTAVTGVLGEGDDAANAPVLVDNLFSTANVIPGSSVRCNWSGAAATTSSCMNADRVSAVKARVDAHAAAGFSTDVAVYCATGRTEAPTVGGFGAIAQTSGGLGTSTTPNVYGFNWGRNGWTNTSTFPASTVRTVGTTAAPSTTYSVSSSALPDCSAESTDAGRVRCAAAWALDTAGGNVSNGVNPGAGDTFASPNLGPVIDIRTPSPAGNAPISSTNAEMQITYNTLFNSDLQYLGVQTSTTKNVFVGRTSIVGGIAAMGARMLGYNAAFLREGASGWSSSQPGTWASTGNIYPTIAATASNVNSGIDQTAPTITVVPAAGSITSTTADISRTANEPATMKVEYGTSTGVYTSTVNNTVLNAAKTVSLAGLSPGTTYYVKVTSYDGQANGTVSSEISFSTLQVGEPTLTLAKDTASDPDGTPDGVWWASFADWLAGDLTVGLKVTNTGSLNAVNVQITGATTSNTAYLITGTPIALGNIASGGGSASTTVKFDVSTVGGFVTYVTASAEDESGNIYTYCPGC